jgi:hypothetical protein
VRASLALVDLAPDEVVLPLFCAIWRAAIGQCDFCIHLCGPTGAGKTELAALVQRHWGSEMASRHLPASWMSTGNSLEAIAFAAKDAVLVIDDFAPGGTTADVARFHRDADRVLRAQGNSAGRQRMRADGGLRPAKPPRGMILSTGEDVPKGQSLRARLFVLEVEQRDLDFPRLTSCQDDAGRGLYAQALSAYLRYLAPQIENIRTNLRHEVQELRGQAYSSGQHRRTPEIVANLALGMQHFLDFARAAEREYNLFRSLR